MSNIIIDYDSTFIKLESLDELSKLSKNNNIKVENKIIEITNLGMEGKISFTWWMGWILWICWNGWVKF